MMRVGVLAVQGDFVEHDFCLQRVFNDCSGPGGEFHGDHLEVVEVRRPEDVVGLHGLILPGGESTVIGRFLARDNFSDYLSNWIKGEC